MTKVAVVILNYNGKKFLQQFLPSVIRFSTEAEIIVADNGSTDNSLDFLSREYASQVSVIKIDKNRGYCGGYNYALKHVDADYYILLNSDVEVTENWIAPIVSLFESNPDIAAAQPKIKSFHEKNKFEYAGAGGGFIDALGYPFCRGRIFNHLEEDHGQYNDTRQVFWATGACLFVRASAFHEMGGLDEDFFAHMEEIDLCWRLNRAGYKIYYCGSCTVYHVGGGTLSKSNPRKTQLNFRNGLSLLTKHLPGNTLWWKLPLRLMLDWLAALLFLKQGSPSDTFAVLKAHLEFIRRLKDDIRKRKLFGLHTQNYMVPKTYQGILPFDYFVRKKTIVKDLTGI